MTFKAFRIPLLAGAIALLAFGGAAAQPNDASFAARDYSEFKLILDRNIFNGERSGTRVRVEAPRVKRVETLTLVGAMTYDTTAYAFFDGTTSDLRKVLEVGQIIADYKIAEICSWGVRLQDEAKTLDLRVGMQLRREEEGDWHLVAGSTLATAPSSSMSASAGEESDIIKRLMQQREQELQ